MAMHLILSDQEMQHLQIRKIQDHKWSCKAPLSFKDVDANRFYVQWHFKIGQLLGHRAQKLRYSLYIGIVLSDQENPIKVFLVLRVKMGISRKG